MLLRKAQKMRKLLLAAVFGFLAGCGGDAKKPPEGDPIIEVYEDVAGGVGPVGGGRARYYKGPESKAPAWVKKQRK
jgi:hypothetical protein